MLEENKLYKVKIRSFYNDGITTEYSPYSSTINAYTRPVEPTIQPATNVTASSFDANWILPLGVTQVKLYVSSNNFSSNDILNGTVVTGSTYTVSGLSGSTEYKYKVVSIGIGIDSNYSGFETVTTDSSMIERIFFNKLSATKQQIYRANIDGTNIISITKPSDPTGNNTYNDNNPIASPDGQYIAFTRESNPNGQLCYMKANGDIFPDTAKDKVILSEASYHNWALGCWRSTNEILFTKFDTSFSTYYVNQINIGDTSSTQVTTDNFSALASINPENDKIVYQNNNIGSNVNALKVRTLSSGSTVTIITGNECETPFWAYNNKIYFCELVGGITQIFRCDHDGSNKTRIVTSANNDREPKVSPISNKLFFIRSVGVTKYIYRCDLDGSNEVQLMQGDNFTIALQNSYSQRDLVLNSNTALYLPFRNASSNNAYGSANNAVIGSYGSGGTSGYGGGIIEGDDTYLDLSNSYTIVSVANSSALNAVDLTIDIAFQFTSFKTTNLLASKYQTSFGNTFRKFYIDYYHPTNEFRISLHNPTSNPSDYAQWNVSFVPSLNTNYLVSLAVDTTNNIVKFFINGVEQTMNFVGGSLGGIAGVDWSTPESSELRICAYQDPSGINSNTNADANIKLFRFGYHKEYRNLAVHTQSYNNLCT